MRSLPPKARRCAIVESTCSPACIFQNDRPARQCPGRDNARFPSRTSRDPPPSTVPARKPPQPPRALPWRETRADPTPCLVHPLLSWKILFSYGKPPKNGVGAPRRQGKGWTLTPGLSHRIRGSRVRKTIEQVHQSFIVPVMK